MSAEEDDDEASSSSSEAEPVEAAVLARSRRATAGRRLTTLAGQAADDDAAFWGHDTWGDADDNESFRESDEDSDQKVDTFDSDFDDDEQSGAEEEKQHAQEAEAEIVQQEKEEKKKKKGTYVETKKKGSLRRIVGQGLNAGIVLNAPGQAPKRVPHRQALSNRRIPSTKTGRAIGTTSVSSSSSLPFATLAATRKPRRSTQQSKYSSRFRSARQVTDPDASHQSHAGQSSSSNSSLAAGQSSTTPSTTAGTKRKLTAAERAGDKKKPKRYTQEELLLEAINETEPENRRWLLQRQRTQTEMDEAHQQAMDRKNQSNGKLIQRYTSRRGALNLIHFPAMDHVPSILRGQPASASASASNVRPTLIKCVITGKPARYRDPRTGLPYHDVAAFRELRKRQVEPKAAPTTQAANGSIDGQTPGVHQEKVSSDPMDSTPTPPPAPVSSSSAAKDTTSGSIAKVSRTTASKRAPKKQPAPKKRKAVAASKGNARPTKKAAKSTIAPAETLSLDKTNGTSASSLQAAALQTETNSTLAVSFAKTTGSASAESSATTTLAPKAPKTKNIVSNPQSPAVQETLAIGTADNSADPQSSSRAPEQVSSPRDVRKPSVKNEKDIASLQPKQLSLNGGDKS